MENENPKNVKGKLILTQSALNQIDLILNNDYTLKDHLFRVKINGKGCSGFKYQLGFSQIDSEDIIQQVDDIKIIMDPFTAFYTQGSTVDYIFSEEEDQDGFTLTNPRENEFSGKFYKDESLLPPWANK